MRTLTTAGLQQLLLQEAADVFLCLLKITSGVTTFRFVNDLKDLTFEANVYTAFPFELTLPDDVEDRVPTVQVRVDNVDRTLIALLRSITVPPDVTLDVVRLSAGVATREIGPLGFKFMTVRYDAATVELELGYEADYLNAPAVRDYFSPSVAPALF